MRSGHKLLADLGGTPVIGRTVDALDASRSLASITVVLGDRADAVREAIGGHQTMTVVAPDHRSGLSASLRAGLATFRGEAAPGLGAPEGILIALGDMPLIEPATIRAVVDRFTSLRRAGHAAPVVRPTCEGQPGHPVLWHRSHADALAALTGDRGGNELLRALGPSVTLLTVHDAGIGFVNDTDAALAEARRLLGRRPQGRGDAR